MESQRFVFESRQERNDFLAAHSFSVAGTTRVHPNILDFHGRLVGDLVEREGRYEIEINWASCE